MHKRDWEKKIKIYFTNEKKCRCRIVSITDTEITCKTDKFDSDTDRNREYEIDVEINGETTRCPGSYNTRPENPYVTTVGSNTFSPTMK
jgi:hypothetical protein